MVGFWNLGLKMIPNDRPRSSLGPPGNFGQTIPKCQCQIHFFRKNKNRKEIGTIQDFRRISIQTAGAQLRTTGQLRRYRAQTRRLERFNPSRGNGNRNRPPLSEVEPMVHARCSLAFSRGFLFPIALAFSQVSFFPNNSFDWGTPLNKK